MTGWLRIFGILFLAAAPLSAQTAVSVGRDKQAGCTADARLEFVRYGKKPSIYSDESDERVWLKFVNRSRKTLTIEAVDDQQTLDFLKKKTLELSIYYEIVKKDSCDAEDGNVVELPVGYTRRDVYYTVTVKPGESFIFSVARQHLSHGQAAYIVYSCARRCGSGSKKREQQRVYFFSSMQP